VPPAPTSTSALVRNAVLGGDLGAFDDAYGTTSSSTIHYTTIGGQVAMLTLTPMQGTDDLTRAGIIEISPSSDQLGSESWDTATLQAFALRLLPPDATAVGDESGANGQSIHDLHSNLLRATFPATVFTNDPGTRTVAPGTLNWSCFRRAAKSANGADYCNISVGLFN
jgi:hypothetical protein